MTYARGLIKIKLYFFTNIKKYLICTYIKYVFYLSAKYEIIAYAACVNTGKNR